MPEVERIRQKNWTPDSVINSHPWTRSDVTFFAFVVYRLTRTNGTCFFLAPPDSRFWTLPGKKIRPPDSGFPAGTLSPGLDGDGLTLSATPDPGLRTPDSAPRITSCLVFRTPDSGT